MSETPLVVIADDYRMAQFYAREHELGREGRDWRYVFEVRQLLGHRPGRYVSFTAGYRDLPLVTAQRRSELFSYLHGRGWTHLEDS